MVESFSRIKRKGRFDTLLSYIRSPVAKDKPAPSKMHRIVSHLHLSVLCTISHDRKYTFIYTFSIHSWISSLAHPLLRANSYEPHFIWNSLRFIHHLLRFVEDGRTWRGRRRLGERQLKKNSAGEEKKEGGAIESGGRCYCDVYYVSRIYFVPRNYLSHSVHIRFNSRSRQSNLSSLALTCIDRVRALRVWALT